MNQKNIKGRRCWQWIAKQAQITWTRWRMTTCMVCSFNVPSWISLTTVFVLKLNLFVSFFDKGCWYLLFNLASQLLTPNMFSVILFFQVSIFVIRRCLNFSGKFRIHHPSKNVECIDNNWKNFKHCLFTADESVFLFLSNWKYIGHSFRTRWWLLLFDKDISLHLRF